MKKRFHTSLLLPVTVEIVADDSSGEVNVLDVVGVRLPYVSEIRDNMTDDNIRSIDDDFAEADQIIDHF